MCGICGKLWLREPHRAVDPVELERMNQVIAHRGPDDRGSYFQGPVGLGHRRLSIIDLSTGHQPISNEDGTIWIVYNGEVYNYLDLVPDLEARGHVFKTKSDTEAIVHLYEEEGEECVRKLKGMFSFALWDSRNQKLLLARDRVGIKPLYYFLNDTVLLFASEVKAILQDPAVHPETDWVALDLFLRHLYVPGERTLFQGIRKLLPGHYLVAKRGKVSATQYWDLDFSASGPNKSLNDATVELTELLSETVRNHMISDVPVGVLLSGGVDSTGILSFAAECSKKVSTFTIGFDAPGCQDERPFARLAAQQFATDHHEMTIGPEDFWATLPKFVWHMEEPVCEPPAIALYFISKLAKERVTVLLSGEGGDEAFAGYPNYRNLVWLERLKRWMGPASHLIAAVASQMGRAVPHGKLEKYAPLLRSKPQDYYLSRTANPWSFLNRHRLGFYSEALRGAISSNGTPYTRQLFDKAAAWPLLSQMLYVDSKTWLPDDLLVKADKMTMANSLELRVPFLDHQVLEFAARLPANLKLRGFDTKYILKKALSPRIPTQITQRPKAGFPVPIQSWVTRQLAGNFREVLNDSKTLDRGYFDKNHMKQFLAKLPEQPDQARILFSLTVLELWHREFLDNAGSDVPGRGR